nr:uncharacterized mitochondrial protein AtMg00810-like [Tanacetum cinerariifolium]
MYSFDLKNVVPQGGLACLFEKFTSEESNLWHRTLGHKGKQHRASCKTKTVSSISQPLEMFHMDLFGLTFVKSLMKKMYCLVVTDDFDALTISMNYKPVVARNQSNGSARTKEYNNAGKTIVETVPKKDYILLPLWTQEPLFFSNSKDSPGVGYKPSGGKEKKDAKDKGNEDNEALSTKETRINQEKDSVNNTNRVNVVSSTVNAASNEVNVVGRKSSIELPDDPNMPEMEDISIFEDSNEDVFGVEAVLNNLESTFQFKLYGLHQAPRAWYETLSTYLLDSEFQRGMIDNNLFIKSDKSDILLVQVYVDDIIFGSTRKEMCTEFEKMMHKKFQMSSMGELIFFLGLQVNQKEDGIFISQDKYVNEILTKFGFSNVKTASTPMETHKTLLKDEKGEDVDEPLYRSMVGSLMYLTSSRPDIMFAICACVKFQVNPKISHLHAVKRIFKYLKGQPKLGLWYPKDSPFDLMAYTDSDYAGASLDMKSTTEGCQFLGCSMVKHLDSGNKFFMYPREDKLKLNELMEIYTKLSERVLNLETTKTAQAKEISRLKKRVKRPKAKSIVMQEPSETPTTTTIPISSKVQDKGKGIMVKEPLKMKKKDQISFNEQEARRLQAEIDEQDRLVEEKDQQIEDENLAWNNIQAMIDADYELAAR